MQRQSESEALWDALVRLRLESRIKPASLDQLTAALYDRIEEAERMLPLPDAGGNVPSPSPVPPGSGKKLSYDPLDSVVSKTGRSRRVFATGGIGKR